MKLLKILKNNNFNLQEIINKYYLLIIYLNLMKFDNMDEQHMKYSNDTDNLNYINEQS